MCTINHSLNIVVVVMVVRTGKGENPEKERKLSTHQSPVTAATRGLTERKNGVGKILGAGVTEKKTERENQ
jgi:hypothetical protein